jgi:hypothetical protein
VIYADDLVILCRKGNAEMALHYLCKIMGAKRVAGKIRQAKPLPAAPIDP